MKIYRINEFVSEYDDELVNGSEPFSCYDDEFDVYFDDAVDNLDSCSTCSEPNTIGEFFGTLQQSVVKTWREHLKTNKYNNHMALDEFYKDMPQKVDAFVESYMGKYGKVKGYKNVMPEDMDAVKYLECLGDFVRCGSKKFISKEDTELLSCIDDILNQIDSTLYKLKELNEMFNIPWTMAEDIGYEPKTTFWQDFTIADRFGEKAVKDTYKRAFNEWKNNYEYLTELVLVLNHKIWEHYERKEHSLARLYDKLWKDTDEYACKNLKGNELNYYYSTTD